MLSTLSLDNASLNPCIWGVGEAWVPCVDIASGAGVLHSRETQLSDGESPKGSAIFLALALARLSHQKLHIALRLALAIQHQEAVAVAVKAVYCQYITGAALGGARGVGALPSA